jgi:hypothetical protein
MSGSSMEGVELDDAMMKDGWQTESSGFKCIIRDKRQTRVCRKRHEETSTNLGILD